MRLEAECDTLARRAEAGRTQVMDPAADQDTGNAATQDTDDNAGFDMDEKIELKTARAETSPYSINRRHNQLTQTINLIAAARDLARDLHQQRQNSIANQDLTISARQRCLIRR